MSHGSVRAFIKGGAIESGTGARLHGRFAPAFGNDYIPVRSMPLRQWNFEPQLVSQQSPVERGGAWPPDDSAVRSARSVSLAAVLAALQLFLSQHPTGGAACILMPANGGSVTRNDIRAIARAELDHDEVVIVMGAPIQTTPPETRMSGAQLLKQLAALPGEPSKRSVVMSAGLQKVDEHYAVDLHNPLRNTGTVTAPEGQLFLLSAELSGETPQEWLQRWKEKH